MSRITGTDAYNLMEAYQEVYAPQELTEEQVWEEVENWVNSLLEEGYDLSEYTWEEMYESYLSEDGKWVNIPGKGRRFVTGTGEVRMGDPNAPLAGFARGVKKFFTQPARLTPAQMRASTSGVPMSGPGSGSAPSKSTFQNTGGYGRYGAPSSQVKTPTPAADTGNGGGNGDKGSGSTITTPAAPKVAPTKPASAQTGDKAKDMDTWAKANPKLAAAAAERARTRGTSSTTNPLMQDMKSRLPAAAAKVSPTPAPARSGFGVSAAPIAAKASVANVTAPEVKATNTIAAKPNLPSVAPTRAPIRQMQTQSYEYDAYDLVLEYLLSEGHAETVEEAHYVMMEMDAETIGSIVEGGFNSSGRYDVGSGRTVGPVAGAVRSLFSGNLPKGQTYVPPSPQRGTNRPPATPSSKDDSGKLTDFGAGGGKAKLKTGMSVGQVERQGRRNAGNYSG